MTAEELSDHVAIGGTLPPGAVKHLVMMVENANTLASTSSDTSSNDDGGTAANEIASMTERPLADWVGV
jgi:hypothetical protein